MYGKQSKIGKVAKNLRFEARQLLAKLLRFSKMAQGVENGVAYKKECVGHDWGEHDMAHAIKIRSDEV